MSGDTHDVLVRFKLAAETRPKELTRQFHLFLGDWDELVAYNVAPDDLGEELNSAWAEVEASHRRPRSARLIGEGRVRKALDELPVTEHESEVAS